MIAKLLTISLDAMVFKKTGSTPAAANESSKS
jgi:hypothetical protein